MKLDSHKVRNVAETDFCKKILVGQEAPKSPKIAQKWSFSGFDKNRIHSDMLF